MKTMLIVVQIAALFLLGCDHFPLKTREELQTQRPSIPPKSNGSGNIPPRPGGGAIPPPSPTIITPQTSAPKPGVINIPPEIAKVGIILGPGQVRSYIHIGILEELHKARMPVTAIVGLEWGALAGALYALHGQSNDVEWQMMKLKDDVFDSHGILSKSVDAQDLEGKVTDLLNDVFQNLRFDQLSIPFSCLSFDMNKKQYFWLKKGELSKSLPYCLAHSPLFKPHNGNIAGMDLRLAIDQLKSQGATFIVFINLTPSTYPLQEGDLDFRDAELWSQYQFEMQKQSSLVDFVIDAGSIKSSLTEASDRRGLIKQGHEIGAKAAKKLAARLGF